MTTENKVQNDTLDPDDAFGVLGDGTRMEIIRTLGEADNPLSFSDLYGRVAATDSGNFTYHLEKLVGHFVADTDKGYRLRRAGERIVEAVVSGAITETPVVEPTEVGWPCTHCGAPTILSYREERVMTSCTECSGNYSPTDTDDPVPEEQLEYGYLGMASLPPAALANRDVDELQQAALAWDFLERIAVTNGICPRCSATVNQSLSLCGNHDGDEGLCTSCGHRRPDLYEIECPNCPLSGQGVIPAAVHGYPKVLEFVSAHGFNPVVPTRHQWTTISDATDVEVLSTDPDEARISYSLDGHYLAITVDEELNVIDVTEDR